MSKHWEGKAAPRIVCAANRFADNIVVGPRHSDDTMRKQIDLYDAIAVLTGKKWNKITAEQGFIDQFGDFHTREEAWKIAEANGQIYRRCGGDTANGGTLYSENLY
jgi:hypothetical protein